MPIIIPTIDYDIRSVFLSLIAMKRVTSIILLSVFLYNVIGYYFTFSILNWQNNSKMVWAVKNASTTNALRIHKSEMKEVIFMDDEKEISYKGEMYDVRNKTIDGDYIVFYCIKDGKEKTLLASLNNSIHNNIDIKSSSKEKHPEKILQKNILKDYIQNTNRFSFYNPFQKNNFLSPDALINGYIVSLSPPPPKNV